MGTARFLTVKNVRQSYNPDSRDLHEREIIPSPWERENSPNQYFTDLVSTTPASTSPNTMMKAIDSPLANPFARELSPNCGFVALDVRMRAARAAADVLMVMWSSCQYRRVSSHAAWLKTRGFPK